MSLFFLCIQVIKALGNPEFFNMVFPLLFDLCNSEPLKSGQAPLASDAAGSGYDKFWILFISCNSFSSSYETVWPPMKHLMQFLR